MATAHLAVELADFGEAEKQLGFSKESETQILPRDGETEEESNAREQIILEMVRRVCGLGFWPGCWPVWPHLTLAFHG